jgi:hypothetical protein
MDVNWQLLLVILAVVAAGGYLALTLRRALRPSKAGCGGSCGCGSPGETQEPLQLTLKRPSKPRSAS